MSNDIVTLSLPLLVRWSARESYSMDLRAGSTGLVVELARAAGASSMFEKAPVELERRRVEVLAGELGELGGPTLQDELVRWVDAILLAQLALRLVAEGVENVAARTLTRVSNLGHVLVSGLRFPVARDDTVFRVLLREKRLDERAYVLKRWLGWELDGCMQRGEVAAPVRVASAGQRHATPPGTTMWIFR